MYFLTGFYLTQPSSKQIICFEFENPNSVLPYNILCTLGEQRSKCVDNLKDKCSKYKRKRPNTIRSNMIRSNMIKSL